MLRRAVLVPTMIAATALLTSCAPMPEADDEGHATFAREAIKLLLGRPARGADEVEVVADIAKLLGRDAAAKMLMKETEFVETWADNLVDLLQVQREFGSGLAAQDQSCWGAPTRSNPDPAIAIWVRDHGPTEGGAPPSWNMTDLLRSAIAIDDLSPVYRANLFTLAMRRGGFDSREEVTTRFMRTYLNRDLTCLRCHGPTFSASNKTDGGGNIVWRRTWTIPGHPEKALFGNYYDAATALNGLRQVMRGDVRKPAGGPFGIRPWGIAASCATDSFTGGPANTPASHEGFQMLAGPNPGAKFGSLDGAGGPASIFELEAALRAGIADLKDGYARLPPGNPILPPDEKLYCDAVQVFAAKCVSCHSSPGPSGSLDLGTSDPAGQLIGVNTNAMPQPPNLAKRVVPSNTAASELWRRINTGIMPPPPPPGGLPPAERPPIQNWIAGGAPHTPDTSPCNTSTIPEVHPNEALAFLTASNLVDGIWMAAMGYRLTIDNTFPRNSQQRDMLWNLTEYEFLPKGWSLKAVLTKIVASNWYGRRAPSISQEDAAYSLPPILDPWIVADPTQVPNPPAHQRYDGQGELVERFRVNTLLRSIGASLAWKQPRRFPDFAYPSPLDQDLGQYLSPRTPGFRGITFQSLLALESQVGLCNKTGRAVGADDWIDKLVDGIVTFNAANVVAPITFGEAWSMLKDRLIQDPSINSVLPSGLAAVAGAKTEQQAVVAFFNQNLVVPGGIVLNTATTAVSPAQLRGKLREGCGVIVKSPQFILTNLTPRSYSDNNMPGPPRLNVCMPGEPCGYAQTCGHWRQRLHAMGHDIACADRSVYKSLWFHFPDLVISNLDLKMTVQLRTALTRQSPKDAATQVVPTTPSIAVVPTIPPIGSPVTPVLPPLARARADIQFDLIKHVKAAGVSEPPKGLGRVHQRLITLCPGTICGFVSRAASDIERCLKNPKENSCQGLQPLCDPRVQDGPASCGNLPADFSESGVLTAWAEGAEVKEASNARILRQDEGQWRSLRQGTKLQAGDLIFLPPTGALRLEMDNVVFGDTRIDDAEAARSSGHLLAVTGPSAEKLLAKAPKRGALSIDQMTAGVQAGRFESQAMTREHLDRAMAYAVKPQHKRTPSVREIMEINADFDALHRGLPRGAVPQKPN